MKPLTYALMLVLMVANPSMAAEENPEEMVLAKTYEHLAQTIIELRTAETNLVRAILINHHMMAWHHFAKASAGTDVVKQLEAAASEITKIANEGGKAVQAVRQTLVEAGHHHHHHHSDAETQSDYVFIDDKEKKAFLDLANRVARTAGSASADQITKMQADLDTLFNAALAAEE
jgi:hypothetical protein